MTPDESRKVPKKIVIVIAAVMIIVLAGIGHAFYKEGNAYNEERVEWLRNFMNPDKSR